MSALRRAHSDEAGQAVVIMALALSAVLALAGLGIDAGFQYAERRREQVAADAAAWAAAVTMATNWNAPDRSARARTIALEYAARNGYNNDGTTNTVTVTVPTSGGFIGNVDYMEVIITVNVRTYFVRVLGSAFESRQVRARAVGGITGPGKAYGLIALSRTACPGLSVLGAGGNKGEVEVEEAGILVNSSCTPALRATGKAKIEAEGVGIDVVGTVETSGNPELSPTPTTGVVQQADPLAYLAPPVLTVPPGPPDINVTNGTVTLDPGVYLGIRVSGNGRVKLRPGTYVIKGGGISVSGNGRVEDETYGDARGVFIYNTCSFYPDPGGTCGGISVSGNGRIELEKETAGTYAGLSIWQPCQNTQTLSVTGAGSGDVELPGSDGDDDEDNELETSGTIYLPCAAVEVSGNGELEIENGQLVADTVTVSGNGEIEIDWDSAASTLSRIPALVE